MWANSPCSLKHEQVRAVVPSSHISLFFMPVCRLSLSSALHPEAPGQDSLFHSARECRERGSLSVCPRGKTNTYLGVSWLSVLQLSLSANISQPLCLDQSPALSFCLVRSHRFSPFTQTQVFCLCADNATDPEGPSDSRTHKSGQESGEGLVRICLWLMEKKSRNDSILEKAEE